MRNAINQWAGLLNTVAMNNPTLRVNTSSALFRKIRLIKQNQLSNSLECFVGGSGQGFRGVGYFTLPPLPNFTGTQRAMETCNQIFCPQIFSPQIFSPQIFSPQIFSAQIF
jgi:hypothetical protein